jgi:hypothetical protein
MRVGMGLIKNEHGVFHVRRKVPKALEVATARAMGVPKERVSWLKETLGTKDEKRAKVLAKPVMMKFDRILAQAEALNVEHPVRTELTEAEIKQISDYFYAYELREDEDLRAVIGTWSKSTSDMSVSFGRQLSSFQSIDREISGRRACPNLQSSRASTQALSAFLRPPLTSG